jgi:hypothetical protein
MLGKEVNQVLASRGEGVDVEVLVLDRGWSLSTTLVIALARCSSSLESQLDVMVDTHEIWNGLLRASLYNWMVLPFASNPINLAESIIS